MKQKRLYRSKTNRVIAGVCGGLGEYFGIDPIIFRILFLFISPLFLIYFILWLFVPVNPNQKGYGGVSSWKVLLVIIFFLLPLILGLTFFAGAFKFINSTTQSPYSKNTDKSATDLIKDANSKMQEVMTLQNKGNLTDIESKRKITLIVDSLSEYKQATEKDPSNIEAWQSLAVINQRLGDAINGRQTPTDIQNQISFYNESARAYYNLGQVYLQKGSKDQAKKALQQALEIVSSSNQTLKSNIQQAIKNI